jgi:hypothetical protein
VATPAFETPGHPAARRARTARPGRTVGCAMSDMRGRAPRASLDNARSVRSPGGADMGANDDFKRLAKEMAEKARAQREKAEKAAQARQKSGDDAQRESSEDEQRRSNEARQKSDKK